MNQRQGANNQKSQRGRPKNSQQVSVVHPQRQQKAEEVKQYWTQHRITLIAYQAQYIYNKKFNQKEFHKQPEKSSRNSSQRQKQKRPEEQAEGNKKVAEQQKEKKRKGRKKADPQFQTGFLFSNNKDLNQQSQDLKVQQLVKAYSNLTLLFDESNQDVDDLQLKQFMKIMLELKSPQIIHEFLPLYDLIYRQISVIGFQKVEKQKDRTEFLKKIQGKLHVMISESPEDKFKKFKEYLNNDMKQTLKLLYVESYCFLAQKFNFNINEFYSEAFSITLQHNKAGNKKVKGD